MVISRKRGIHPKESIKDFSSKDLKLLSTIKSDFKLITASPNVLSLKDLKSLKDLNFKVFGGHTDASFEETKTFLNNADGYTHLFNASSGLTARILVALEPHF